MYCTVPIFRAEASKPGLNENQVKEIVQWVNEEKATREEMEVRDTFDHLICEPFILYSLTLLWSAVRECLV